MNLLKVLLGSVVWNSAFNVSPAGSDDVGQGDDKIVELKEAVYERLVKEHEMDETSGAAAEDGWHRAGSAVTYTGTSNPTTRPDGVTALNAADNGRLFMNTTTSKLYYYKHGTGWVIAGIQEFPVGGTYIQIDATAGLDPGTLFGGTWSNVSSSYAGLFFRAEGGSAAAFGSSQAANMTAHTHTIASHVHDMSHQIVPVTTTIREGTGNYHVVLNYDSTPNPQPARVIVPFVGNTGGVALTTNSTGSGTDNRPVNSTVRIWKRTA